MTKLPLVAVVLAAAALSGCQPCSNCSPEYEYESSSPTTIYKYTTYPDGSSFESTVQTAGTWIDVPSSSVPLLDFNRMPGPASYPISRPWWNRPTYYSSFSSSTYAMPSMELNYPAEQYYPFKRSAPTTFMPWSRVYAPAPFYYTPPQMQPIYPGQMW